VRLGKALKQLIEAYPEDLRVGLVAPAVSAISSSKRTWTGDHRALRRRTWIFSPARSSAAEGGESEIRNWIVCGGAAAGLDLTGFPTRLRIALRPERASDSPRRMGERRAAVPRRPGRSLLRVPEAPRSSRKSLQGLVGAEELRELQDRCILDIIRFSGVRGAARDHRREYGAARFTPISWRSSTGQGQRAPGRGRHGGGVDEKRTVTGKRFAPRAFTIVGKLRRSRPIRSKISSS